MQATQLQVESKDIITAEIHHERTSQMRMNNYRSHNSDCVQL